jgi:RNA polymerase sigma factor (sigma-70 family)
MALVARAPRSGARPPGASMSPATTASRVTDEARFLAALPVIDDVAAQVCRRHRLHAEEAEDFRADVRLHFINRDYEVLRRFEGRSQLSTYITVVVQRLFIDTRNRQWGRWRPSADARRLGPTGLLLEKLMVRDGWSASQALDTLRVNHGATIDAAHTALADKLATRAPSRRIVGEEDAGEIAGAGPGADANVVRAEQDFLARRVQSALDRARQALAPTDRLVLEMRFGDRLSVADIARALSLDQRRLYRTIEQLLASLGESLRADGISRADITALFQAEGLTWTGECEAPAATDVSGRVLRAERKGAS